MENKEKLAFSIIIIVLVIVGAIYLGLSFKKPASDTASLNDPSVRVLTPKSLPEGTKILLYKEAPPLFPKEVVLEDKALDYSGMVDNADGRKQISVSYISDKKMRAIANLYEVGLPKVGWKVIESTVYEKVAIIRASKGPQSFLMSIAPLRDDKVHVTFQFESR